MHGMIRNKNVFTGKPVKGSYSTPDGKGHVEGTSGNWTAWRDDNPGVEAICDTLREAAQYAHHG